MKIIGGVIRNIIGQIDIPGARIIYLSFDRLK